MGKVGLPAWGFISDDSLVFVLVLCCAVQAAVGGMPLARLPAHCALLLADSSSSRALFFFAGLQ